LIFFHLLVVPNPIHTNDGNSVINVAVDKTKRKGWVDHTAARQLKTALCKSTPNANEDHLPFCLFL